MRCHQVSKIQKLNREHMGKNREVRVRRCREGVEVPKDDAQLSLGDEFQERFSISD